MPVREKPDERMDSEIPRTPRRSVEREVGLSQAIDGIVSDGPAIPRVTPIEAAQQRRTGGIHPERGRRRRKLRLALVLGALLLTALPLLLRATEMVSDQELGLVDADPEPLLASMTILKAIMLVIAIAATTWRLRRRAGAGRRTGYFAGVWAMAAGVGLVASRSGYVAGTALFDLGALLMVACAYGDEHMRRERPIAPPPA